MADASSHSAIEDAVDRRPDREARLEASLAREATELFEHELAKAGKAPRAARLPFPLLATVAHLIVCVGIGSAIGGFAVFMIFLIVNKLLHLI